MATSIRDLMGTTLAQVDAGASPTDAAKCMRDAGVGDVLVTENGKLRGIVTDRDLVVRCMAEPSSGDVKVGAMSWRRAKHRQPVPRRPRPHPGIRSKRLLLDARRQFAELRD